MTTTRIFCRADCGARPQPQNVRPMRNAVAAMAAGFRPCLVCRPDRPPYFGLGNPPTDVVHAVRLIAARVMGATDACPAGDLGLRRAATKLLGLPRSISAVELDDLQVNHYAN